MKVLFYGVMSLQISFLNMVTPIVMYSLIFVNEKQGTCTCHKTLSA